MDKVQDNSYTFSPNTGCRFLSGLFFLFAFGCIFLLFQAFVDMLGRIFLFFSVFIFFWLFWITYKLSYLKVRINYQGISAWNSKTNRKIFANWADFAIVYRLHGIRGATTFIFAVHPMNSGQVQEILKKSFSYKDGIHLSDENNICISAGFHAERIEAFFSPKIPIQDIDKTFLVDRDKGTKGRF